MYIIKVKKNEYIVMISILFIWSISVYNKGQEKQIHISIEIILTLFILCISGCIKGKEKQIDS